jgi:hypothetical protein
MLESTLSLWLVYCYEMKELEGSWENPHLVPLAFLVLIQCVKPRAYSYRLYGSQMQHCPIGALYAEEQFENPGLADPSCFSLQKWQRRELAPHVEWVCALLTPQ